MTISQIKRKSLLILLTISILGIPGAGLSKTVSLPLTIDYPLLESLVVKAAFKEPGKKATLTDDVNDCWQITMSDPSFSQENGLLRFQSKITIHASLHLLNRCMFPVDWEGYLVLFQKPMIGDDWVLSFDTQDSALYDKQHEPAAIAGIVWKLIQESVYTYLGSITINLAPPVSELKSFISPLFPPDLHSRAVNMINAMKPGRASTTPGAVRVEIRTDIADDDGENGAAENVKTDELTRLVESWEAWDAYLVFMITSLAAEPLTDSDRRILMDVLLETRHGFVQAFIDNTLDDHFIREQFIDAWQELSGVFRHHLGDDPASDLLGYLAFFTASDALAALDAVGPELGIEISRDGLIRLVRMISDKNENVLSYGTDVDQDLRSVLGFGSPLPVGDSARKNAETPLEMVRSVFFRTAWAGETAPEKGPISRWVWRGNGADAYIERVKALLQDAGNGLLAKSERSKASHHFFQSFVLSAAWQESCFRQFVIRTGKITYLRSYNGTSVGLMQINERVWRGIYDRQRLRWDIRYNGMAGCEIVDIYYRKYALKRLNPDQQADIELLAGVIYAMYNGGPRQLRKYLKRHRAGTYYLSDRLFSEKFNWVRQNQWDKVRICLIGK